MIYQFEQSYFVRPLEMADIDGPYPGWFQDDEVCRYNRHSKFPKSRAWFESYVRAANQDDRVVWAICHKEDGHIGNITLENISVVNRSAEFAIILGDKRHWGKGIGLLAGKALVRHGFEKINLHRIYCGTAASNEGMKKLALALDMSQEGIRRQHLFLEGEWVDMIEYGVLRDEFTG